MINTQPQLFQETRTEKGRWFRLSRGRLEEARSWVLVLERQLPQNLVLECLCSMHKALGSIPSTRRGEKASKMAHQVSVLAFTHVLLALETQPSHPSPNNK